MKLLKKLMYVLLSLGLCTAALPGCSTHPAPATSPSVPTDTSPDTEGTDEQTPMLSEFEKIQPADGNKVRIACIGDSITYGTGISDPTSFSYPSQLKVLLGKKYVVGNFGRAGAYALDADNKYNVKEAELSYRNTPQYRDSLLFEPDVVIIMLGSNDIRSLSCEEAKEELIDAIQSLAQEYAALPTVKKTYIASCKYSSSGVNLNRQMSTGELARLIKQAADEIGFSFIDVYGMTREYMDVHIHYTSDRGHPTKEGYKQIAKAVHAALTETEPDILSYPVSSTGVVYVKDGGSGSNSGSSPENAIDSIAKAAGLLRKDGGTIVICGPYSTNYTVHMPVNDKKITVTSVYGGVDYRQSAGAALTFTHSFYMFGDYEYDDVDFRCTGNLNHFGCNYNNVTIGEGVTCTLDGQDATYMQFLVGAIVSHPMAPIHETSLLDGDCNVTISGGTWLYLNCGNRRENSSQPIGNVSKDSTVTVVVNGGTFTNTGGNTLTSATGMNSTHGTCRLIINGGSFNGPIFAVGRAGGNNTGTTAVMDGKVYLEINGGSFAGQISAAQDGSVTVTGEVHVKCIASLESKLSGKFTSKEIK